MVANKGMIHMFVATTKFHGTSSGAARVVGQYHRPPQRSFDLGRVAGHHRARLQRNDARPGAGRTPGGPPQPRPIEEALSAFGNFAGGQATAAASSASALRRRFLIVWDLPPVSSASSSTGTSS